MIKKYLRLIALLLGLVVFVAACSPVSTPSPTVTQGKIKIYTIEPDSPAAPDSPPMYSVTKSTGLYDALYYANVKADLPKGAKLIPMNGATVLACVSFVVTGITYELCKVEVVNSAVYTGQSGWVLKKWISKD